MLQLKIESWVWWSVVILVAAARIYSRRITLSTIRKFQADDYLMLVVLAFYTTFIATINIVRDSKSNLLPPGFDLDTLDENEIQKRAYGSKLILVVEQCMCVVQWGAKSCLIILYLRLTTMRGENIAIKVLAAYVVVSFIIMDILYFGVWCEPFHNYWAVPTPNKQCNAATHHLITNAVFNLTSDVAMMAIGLPMFLRMNLPWKKKIPLVGIFSLGLFTILAAILNKVYSFNEPFGGEWTYWYVRESSTALLVVNLPFVWTIWRRIIGSSSITGRSGHGDTYSPHTVSGRDTTAPDTTPDHQHQQQQQQSPSKATDDWLTRNSLEEHEMEHSRGNDMTFAEMLLQDDATNTTSSEKDPTPYTHPALFYSRQKSSDDDDEPLSRIEKAVLRDVRRGNSPDESNGGGGVSVLKGKESASSFV